MNTIYREVVRKWNVAFCMGLLGVLPISQASAQFASCSSGPTGSLCLSSGAVGIGTTTPGALLQVGTNTYSGTGLNVHGGDGGPGSTIMSVQGYGGTNVLTILGNGNIALGGAKTISGLSGLTINHATAPTLALSLSSAGTSASPLPRSIDFNLFGGEVVGAAITSNDRSYNIINTDMLFQTTNSSGFGTRMLIDTSGNVGIGTSSPQHMLHVAGTIGAKEIIVSSTGADYVFDAAYRLAPLAEVAAYVRENHHLPNIPSAAEVAEKGVSLGEMQSRLLAKVEELTLHMIESEERNRELQRRIVQLEEAISKKLTN